LQATKKQLDQEEQGMMSEEQGAILAGHPKLG
jgi:hypothetical protein